MEKELYKSDYLIVKHETDNNILESEWFFSSINLSPETLKREMKNRMNYIENLRPKGILVNARNFFYKLSPAIQEWMNKEILKKYYEAGVEKMAFIISNDLIAQVSIEQAIQESDDTNTKIKYFDKIERARKWLKDVDN